MRAVALLSFWKIRNAARTVFTDPRKLIPLILFVLCMGVPIVMTGVMGNETRRTPGEFHVDLFLFHTVTFLVMILLGVATIDTGLGDGLLAFGMSDVDYLFPSPISRKVVLAYRLPTLTLGALGSSLFIIYMFRMATMILSPSVPVSGHAVPAPSWMAPVCIALCVGIYLNVAMFFAVRFKNRRVFHRVLMGLFYAGGGVLLAAGWFSGVDGIASVLTQPAVVYLFYPSKLASDAMNADLAHQFQLAPFTSLLIGYSISFIPMFSTNSNFYEQSISSSERVSLVRNAAKGGYASLMASKAANYKRKSNRTYTVVPFGSGAVALLWAHLCAAGKRPFVNFAAPVAAGIFDGAFAAFANGSARHLEGFGYGALVGLTAYLSFGFMAAAKTSSESAIRRKELIAPLPIKGWQAVAANLGVPFLAVVLFSVAAAGSYTFGFAPNWPLILFGLCIFFPLRTASRMLLQYMVVLGYPDFSDKIQQFLAMGVYYVLAAPLILAEFIIAIPGLLLHSWWVGIVMLTGLEAGLLVLMLWLVGLASDRAVASGEPVNVFRLLSRKAVPAKAV